MISLVVFFRIKIFILEFLFISIPDQSMNQIRTQKLFMNKMNNFSNGLNFIDLLQTQDVLSFLQQFFVNNEHGMKLCDSFFEVPKEQHVHHFQ
jgi:hypothetical protein